MTDTTKTGGTAEMRELSLDEIDATAGGGILGDIVRFIGGLFGAGNPQPPRSPFNPPPPPIVK